MTALYFYTNYNSTKGQSIAHDHRVCLSFFLAKYGTSGNHSRNRYKLSAKDSDQYFNSLHVVVNWALMSLIKAQKLKTELALETKLAALETQYQGRPIPRPTHWGGYVVTPSSIEFWQGRANRLHDRLAYKRESSAWTITRLSP